jgi:hypothetical protein
MPDWIFEWLREVGLHKGNVFNEDSITQRVIVRLKQKKVFMGPISALLPWAETQEALLENSDVEWRFRKPIYGTGLCDFYSIVKWKELKQHFEEIEATVEANAFASIVLNNAAEVTAEPKVLSHD